MTPWLKFILILIGFTAGGWIIGKIFLHKMAKLFEKTENRIDDLIFHSIRRHIPLWFFLAGTTIGSQVITLHLQLSQILVKGVIILFFTSISFVIANFLTGAVRIYANQLALKLPTTSLSENLVRVLVFGIGILLILSNLGISITPILTALGVGSLAVALALQETLANLFAGVHIIVNRQIRVGDYIRLESGQEGYVIDVGLRTTRVRELPNNIILIPNSKLSQTIVTNYYLPEKEMSVVFQVGVDYGSDLKKVESVTIEVAKEVLKTVQGGVAAFEPFIRYHTFGDSSINFSVILRVKEFTDRYLISHEFVKKLQVRYKEEGITIPFPQRVLHQAGA
ncbi:MAG: hypothetical protein A3I11_02895 [Elusimicrobia bacterium RIFCSPLOWO2_02_FULL_39_32]|nr:MAG: hypothetical protein A2034_00580 [Elusimicrobia bacterium GWA2_38_7]OGR80377.1 MAG: hypothetical protein A3B80_01700 [Elusimicrobia bacterium RIFCSPHIGHO2_02_FULL_39_36]OGR93671.1 MAG: hypothetical protein A3I11_02895 [Elusimicrobia bacterium RIFCSPLOWO2_02_FULL_39_32]OGS00492.1 MAG: hypothetical protein A3G85_09325 [Elusimicrobia bacterium RIFCSPLOWO2_12_FULL_39_28]